MKKILNVLLVLFIASTAPGCRGQGATASGPEKSYDLMGSKVSFVTPGEPWVEKVQTVGEEEAELGMPADTVVGITFQKPDGEGLIAVGALGQQKNEDGEFIELENDQDTLNQIAMWVEKRDGERLNEEYIKVLGTNAFHMTFEVGQNERKQKGEQIHFTRDGRHYTLSLLVPEQDYDDEVGQFRDLVSSFTLENTPAASPTPAE